jgi:hypothetical protein
MHFSFNSAHSGRDVGGQDGRLGEYAFFALRSLLDIQNFLIQRQKKYARTAKL